MQIESVPQSWSSTSLGSVAKFVNGYAFQPRDWGERGRPIIRIAQMQDAEATCDYYSGTLPEQYRIDSGDLLFSWSATLMALIWDRGPACLNQHIFKVIPSDGTDLNFLHHFLNFHIDGLAGQSHGTTMKHIKRSDLIPYAVSLPPLHEQRRIAEILDTLDEAIRKTEEVIAKLQQIKQGLLHDLLTRGIDENGELRDPERHPEQFKDSPLGRIPRGWRVSALGELLDSVIDFRGRTPKKLGMSWGGGDIPALSAKNVRMGNIDLTLETYYGSPALYERWMTSGHARRGDVLLTMEAPLGNVAQIPDDKRYILSQRVVLLKFDEQQALNAFIAFQMRYQPFQANLRRWSTGTTATGIQRAKLVLVPLVVPPLAEQKRAITSILAADSKLAAEHATVAKLRTLKQGLMDDLLTGRVRVPVPEGAAA